MHSTSIANLLPALASAIAEMPDPRKNAKNDHFKNKYADLGEVQECIAEPLAKHGLMVTQTIEAEGLLRTRLWHVKSLEWIDSVVRLVTEKAGMQPLGSAITYARRYALKALFGMVDVDDDGKRTQRPAKQETAAEPVKPFDVVEEAVEAIHAVTTAADLKACIERVRMSGFSGTDREKALAAHSAKVAELKGVAKL